MGRVKKERRKEQRRLKQRNAAPRALAGAVAWAQDYFSAKRPVLRFVSLFAVSMTVYYVFSTTPSFKEVVFPAYLKATAYLSCGLLNGLGEQCRQVDFKVVSPRFALEIRRGCDAIEPSALFVAAILAWPAPARLRALGVLVGVPFLLLVNFVRIISLYYTGVFFPDAFHTMHVEVWQPVFILLVLAVWILWVVWTVRRMVPAHEA